MSRAKRRPRGGGAGGQVTCSIVYRDHHHPHEKQSVTVTVPTTEIIDERRAAGIVALRTSTPLQNVRIVSIST